MASSWFSRLFQGPGSSQDERDRRYQALADLIGYPGALLRTHQAEGDLVADPSWIWRVGDQGGLCAHILANPLAAWTDVLLLLSHQDFAAATSTGGVPWLVRAQEQVEHGYAALQHEQPHLTLPDRRLRLRLVADGSGDVKGQSFGLQRGEFMTGLASNTYTGPSTRSKPRLAIHLNLPGVTQGYARVGRLFDDQLAFSLGSHWLDNYSDPELLEPGLYTVRRLPEGGFEHGLRPDLMEEYSVDADEQQGVSILTLRARNRPFAHLIFEVLGQDAERDFNREALQRLRLSFDLGEVAALLDRMEKERPSAEGRQADSRVEMVVVYADRAVVTRAKSQTLDLGRHVVRFKGLLPTLDKSVIKAEIRSGRARIVAVRTLSDAQAEAVDRNAIIREARASLATLSDLRAQVEDLLRQRAALGGSLMATPASTEPEDGGAITQVRRRLDLMRRSDRDLEDNLALLCARAAAIDDRLRPNLERLAAPAQDGQTVEVELEVRAAGEVDVGLRYPVTGVRWTPQYRARYVEASGQVELSCVATVHQATGEDWEDVRVLVSSAVDQRRTEPPPVRPWALAEGPELAALLRINSTDNLTMLTGKDQETSDPSLLEAQQRFTVRDGVEGRALVLVETLPADEGHVVAPRQDPAAYRVLTLKRPNGPALPEGPLTCFLGNHYVGNGRLPSTEEGGTLTLGMGVDPLVQVQRNLASRDRRPDGPGKGLVGYSFHYRTVIMNRRSSPLRLKVVDQLPLATGGGVQVQLESAASNLGPAGRLDPQDHVVTWDLMVPGLHLAGLDLRFLLVVPAALESSAAMRLSATADTLVSQA